MLLFSLFFSASAHESDPQAVLVSDQVTLFDAEQLDSGWYPSSGAMGVRVQIGANGTADVNMEGSSNLQWPEDLNLSFQGMENGGEILLSAVLATTVSIRFDISGYQWEQEIASRDLEFSGNTQFTPFSIGTTQQVATENSGNEVINYETTVLVVVDVRFSGDLRPNCALDFTGVQWGLGENTIQTEGQAAIFSATAGAPSFDQAAVYSADLNTECALEFVPVFEVCVPIAGCTDWEAGQVEIDAITSAISHDFPANNLQFPLPALQTSTVVDFGDVERGMLSNQELVIENPGLMLLEGSAQLQDEASGFSIFGPNIYLPSSGTDSIVFAFLHDSLGEHTTTIEIASNDPAAPTQEIILKANVVQNGKSSCSHFGKTPTSLLLLLPGLLFLCRRKREE